jgi:dTMP kinase
LAIFITFEGGEGSGKSTQAKALYRRLSSMGISVLFTREPGGTPLGNNLRRWLKGEDEIDPTTELLLFAASRAHLVSAVIRPALEKGTIVICDRFAESTVAYQGYGRGLDFDLIEVLNKIATQGLKPDLIIFLDIPVDNGLARKGLRDRFEREESAFHQRVRRGYLEMASKDPERWLVIDGSLPKKDIRGIVWKRVASLLKLR